jgi:hypothetical protein
MYKSNHLIKQKMKSHIIILITTFAATLILNNPANSQPAQQKSQSLPDSVFFNSLITLYVQSINEADTTLASEIWARTAEISFINPRGTEYGWNGVKTIYKMFKDSFSVRKLSFYNLKFAHYDNVSWLTFYWIFDAKMKPDDTPVQTRGRETQIWKKMNSGWRLVHVHYSAMPVAGQGKGF